MAKWRWYAHSRHIDPISLSISEADVVGFGQHKIVRRIMKGVFELKPVLPKYSHTWDVDTVLNLLECYAPNDKLTLKELSHKLVMLLALLTGQRCQTIHKLCVKSMKLEDNKCLLHIVPIKTVKAG